MADDLASDRANSSVPASQNEVTAAWLRNALSSAFLSEQFETIELQRIGVDYGLASQIFRCRLGPNRPALSVVIKLWRTDTPAGINEALFYRTFGYATGTRIPACFHAALDSDKRQGVLILEDITAAVQGDCLQQLTLDQAKVVARSLAGVHATWLQHDVLREAEWLPSMTRWETDATWFASRRASFIERFDGWLVGLTRSLLHRIEHIPAIANERLGSAATTLLHADLHLDNLLIEEDTQPVILDWARCAKGPLALDLAALLFEMCRQEDIEHALASYLDFFHERSPGTLDAAVVRRQLGGALLRRFASATCGVAQWQPASRREQAMIEAHIRRASDAVRYWSGQDPDLFSFLK